MTLIFDSEVFRNYYLAMFCDVDTGEVHTFEAYPGRHFIGTGVRKLMASSTVVGFNIINYDFPLLAMALAGAECDKIKEASDAIIKTGLRSWQVEQQFNVRVPKSWDHIDLIEVAPGIASLKIYGGRLHSPKMQDLPIDFDALIAPSDRPTLRKYCANDLAVCGRLYDHLLPQIALRESLGRRYELDLRSKSDAQIAEAVIAASVSRIKGFEIVRPAVEAHTFHYKRPDFLQFRTPEMQNIAWLIDDIEFDVLDNGTVAMPKELAAAEIRLGSSVYRMGIGGLHSSEKSTAHLATADTLLIDRDVTSYYPAIILRLGLTPPHMGEAFTSTYQKIVLERLAAKLAGDKVMADSLKITVNGSFGKFGSKWSKLYAPKLMIQTTLTGQLAVLMLIEHLELAGIPVVSGNTDGIVIKCPKRLATQMDCIVASWEAHTGLETEATAYRALYSRDVNNYIALKADGGAKLKGVYAPAGLQKNPTNEICAKAVLEFLASGTALEITIAECRDITKFVSVRTVKGGAVKDGAYLGKAVRWYYSTQARGVIQYKVNGYTVARTEGAQPLMDLPEELPADIDLAWYVTEAESILQDVGYQTQIRCKEAA